MKSYFSVLKLLLTNLLRIDKHKKGKTSERVAIVILISFSYLFIALSGIIGLGFGTKYIVQYNLLNEVITILFAAVTLVIFILGLVSMFTALFFSKDTEFFLSLPIKPSVVFLAKFSLVYLTELIIAAAILVPALITIGIAANMGFIYFVVVLLGIVLAPAFSLILASIIALPLMFVVSFFKNKGALTSLVVILLFGIGFGAYMFFAFNMNGEVSGSIEGTKATLEGISKIVYPFLALSRAATLTPFGDMSVAVSVLINLGIFLLSTLGLIVIASLIANFIYKRGAASQLETQKTKSNGTEKFVEGTALKALIKKEWRELIRTPAFAYQCLSTVFLTPILVAFLSFSKFSSIFEMGAEQNSAIDMTSFFNAFQWFIGFGMLIMFGIGMNIAASTAITREGKSFYYSKMLPVDYKTQIKAKQILYMIISMTASALGLIVLTVATKNFLFLPFGIVFIIFYAYGFNNFAIYNDLKKPKLDWATPNEAVKQNFRIMLPYLLNMAMSVVFIIMPIIIVSILWLVNSILASLIIWVVFYGFAALVALVFRKLLNKNIDRLYEDLTI